MLIETTRCRICGNGSLQSILQLGEQCLTGRFPKSKTEKVASIPLDLVKCDESKGHEACGLVQLRYTAELGEMYGAGYGYRSGLNASMVAHLRGIVERVEKAVTLKAGDLVIDIGANDSTTLRQYKTAGLNRVGVDPTGPYFKEFYPADIRLVPDFFSAAAVRKALGEGQQARVVTSIAMFYDLPEPLRFVQDIYDVLAPGGIWTFEQSYMPTMVERNSFDTVCHEHLEYYGLRQVKWMTDRVGFEIMHVELTEANGGSFLVMARKPEAGKAKSNELPRMAKELLDKEAREGYATLKPYQEFAKRIEKTKKDLLKFFADAKAAKQTVYGYGASTKGNVLLQYCGITPKEMPYIAEVNKDKFGAFTPGTLIPIISEDEARKKPPTYFLVLPWHFRESILQREAPFRRESGCKFVFPLPELQIV